MLKTGYYPSIFFPSGNLQTIASVLFRKGPTLSFSREILTLPKGGEIVLDWHQPQDVTSFNNTSPIVVLLHGLNGTRKEKQELQIFVSNSDFRIE